MLSAKNQRRESASLLIKGGHVIDPAAKFNAPMDVLLRDGRVLITRFIDKDAATRYGNMVYVRCGPHA